MGIPVTIIIRYCGMILVTEVNAGCCKFMLPQLYRSMRLSSTVSLSSVFFWLVFPQKLRFPMPPLLSSKIHNFPFRECLRTGFTATINVRTPRMLRYISTPSSSNTGHGPIPENADEAHGERKGRLSGSVLILSMCFFLWHLQQRWP